MKEVDENTVFKKKINITLNKITPESYDKLYKELFDLSAKSEECAGALAEYIIKKAWEDANYSKLYAQLCKQLSDVPELKFNGTDNVFRSQMMSKIQKTFEGEIKVYTKVHEKKEEDMSPEEKAEIALTVKRRTKNNFRFIGELYNSKFLNRVIIYNCFFSQLDIYN